MHGTTDKLEHNATCTTCGTLKSACDTNTIYKLEFVQALHVSI